MFISEINDRADVSMGFPVSFFLSHFMKGPINLSLR